MTDKQIKVVKGYTELSETEKREVIEFLNKYNQSDYTTKTKLFSNLNESRTVGVTGNNNCPCCGK